MAITIDNGIIKLDGKPILLPRDAQFQPASLLFGITSTGEFIPVQVNNDGSLATGNTASQIQTSKVTVGTAATELAPEETDRRTLFIYNIGSTEIYIKGDNTVSTNDYPLPAGGVLTLRSTGPVYAIASTNVDVRILKEI